MSERVLLVCLNCGDGGPDAAEGSCCAHPEVAMFEESRIL